MVINVINVMCAIIHSCSTIYFIFYDAVWSSNKQYLGTVLMWVSWCALILILNSQMQDGKKIEDN